MISGMREIGVGGGAIGGKGEEKEETGVRQ